MSNQIQELPDTKVMTAGGGLETPLGKILVVDDERELRTVLVESLRRHGYEVTGCGSGRAALDELHTRDFDLLLTDLMMPEMDGIALLKAALEIDPHLIGIMLTGQGTIQTAVDAMQVGAFDYVLKPFRMQSLMPVLTRALNTRQLRLENLQLRETVAIHELTQTIAFTLDPQTVMSKLTEAALQQTRADEVSVLLPTTAGNEFYVAAARGERQERLLGERIPFADSIASWVARERTPVILNGEVNDERFVALWPRPAIRSSVSVPMVVANKLLGVLNVNVTKGQRPLALGQMKALSILAGTAAAALETASLYTQVRTTEEKYRSIFENATEGLFQTSPEGQLLTANPALARIFGYDSPEEMIGAVTDIAKQLCVNPEDRAEVGRRQAERGTLAGFEIQNYRKDGKKIWLSLNQRSVLRSDGEVLYFEGSIEDITQRKHAEEERAELTAEIENHRLRLNNMVASVPGVVWEAWGEPAAATQRIDFVSEYVESLLGYSVEEWISTPNFWLTIVHPSDREEAGRLATEAYERGRSCRLEFRWLTKDGREVWIESNFVVILDEVGKPVGMRGVNTDSTERKRAEEALKQSERQLAEAQSLAHIGSWNVDLQTNALTWSDEHYRIFGVEPGGIDATLGDEVFDMIHPDDREEVRQQVARTIETKESFNLNCRIIRPDGEERIIQSSGTLASDEAGKPVRLFGTAQDITEREQAQRLQAQLNAEIREQRERLDTIVGSVPGIVFESWGNPSTAENRTDFVSDYIETMLGYSVAEWLSTPRFWLQVVHPDDRKRVKREAELVQISNRPKGEFEFRWIGKDTRIVWVRAHTTNIRDEQGKSIGVRGVVTDITAGKQAEKALRESEERYRELVENADDLIYEHDLKGNYTASNKAGERITGYTLEESLTLNLMDTVAPECIDKAKEMLRRKLAGEKVTAYELVIITKKGRRVPVEVNTRLVLKEGVPVGVQGIARDITERKRVEEIQARRETHALFRADISAALAVSGASLRDTLASCAQTMVHHLDAAFARIWTLNHDGQVLELQASAGVSTDLDGPYSSVPVGSFKIGKIALERKPLITNEVQNGRVDKQGWARTEGMVAFAGYPLIIDDRVVGVMAMFSRKNLAEDTLDALASVADLISRAIERKRAEEALGESEERYRLLFESNPQPMWVYDLETLAFLAVNQAAVAHYGYSPVEFLSMTIKDIRPPGDWLGLQGALAAVSEGSSKDGGWRHLKKDGSLIEVEITAHPLVFDGRRAELILANDITERVRLEAALMASEDQLRQSQKLEAVGQLAGGVAHDFNNLLTVIGGYSSLLLAKLPKESPHHSNVEEIKKASDRAGALTRQLLAFSRKQILQPKILDLNIAVADLEKMLRRLIGEDIDLLTVMSPGLGKVKADPGQIEQVLLNLIVNARDAMPQGGKLTIETINVVHSLEYAERHGTHPGAYVMLAVTDNGCGMDTATQGRIFEPFFTTKAAGRGTGLGLATVYGIVKQSGGNIWVYSEKDRGTTFKIFLPRVDEVHHEDSGPLKPIPYGTETVLVVEDEDQVRAILTHILEGQGYQVVSASNGEQALSISRDLAVDLSLMITDVVMPQMSGRELAEQVAKVRPHLPVLFMSGYTDDAIVRHGLLDEKLNFIQKPFDSAGVARKVREVLDSNQINPDLTTR